MTSSLDLGQVVELLTQAKYGKIGKMLYFAFIDLDKAPDNLQRC